MSEPADLSGRRLTLSFDNGPFPDVTPGVLDVLRERDLRANFFVCGKDASDPEKRGILERTRAEGHRIGNHTQTHTIELGMTDDPCVAEAEIGLAQRALGELSEPERWFRPYGGGGIMGPNLLSRSALGYLRAGAYSLVLWNSVPRDWEDPDGWPERALAEMGSRDWTLVVVHDVPTGAMKALPRFLDRALAESVEIVQDFPADCVPMLRGKVLLPVDDIVAAPC
jgi:peptidoglycan/xylan/chitin deacetylase (PgdA/CDA1 family)